jgi:hypothetical protein
MRKLGPKDKCIHKYMNDHIRTYMRGEDKRMIEWAISKYPVYEDVITKHTGSCWIMGVGNRERASNRKG